MRYPIIIAVLWLLSSTLGCSAPYRQRGFNGGYRDVIVGDNTETPQAHLSECLRILPACRRLRSAIPCVIMDRMPGINLSAVVIAQNSAAVLDRCLASLHFADEIVVVDALSYDDTPSIARRHGARIVSNRWPGFAAQLQRAIDEARGKWVLRCDTDEEVPEELAREILATIDKPNTRDGYRLRRRNQFLGEWMTVGPWTHDVVIRLYRAGKARMTRASVHEGEVIDGTLGWLEGRLNHYAHPSLAESVARMNRYTTLEAADRVDRRRIRMIDAVIPPLGVFLNYYLWKGCWRAGVRGLLLSATTAMYKSVLYIKIYMLQRTRASS